MEHPQKHIVIDARIRRSSTGRYVDRLVEHLQKNDSHTRYTVLVEPDDPWQPSAGNFTRATSPYPQFSFNPLHQLGFAWQLYKLGADIVHFPMNQQPLLYFKPVVTSCMDLTMLRFTRPGRATLPVFWLRMAGYRFLFWYSLRKSKAIITISQFVKQDVENHYPFATGRITVTYCASEPPLGGKALAPPGVNQPFIMHVGSPFPHKNIERLIEAFAILKKSHPKLQLVLVGKKEYHFTQLEEQAQANPFVRDIIFTGFVSEEELKWLYQNAEAYVLPSLSEGFGLPGLEAMVHGCPVVSSNATCLPEVYGNAAHYFDPKSTEDIAQKTDEVLANISLRKTLIKEGYVRLKKYSWQRMAEQTLEIYRGTL
ncbi:MAG TPA: glycosyltransferase family 1 protein [Candidatus Limnocylindria bacterium]|nr:glycosyltransferase family 1 protein [Candidatus Limnocylindria bacterium]